MLVQSTGIPQQQQHAFSQARRLPHYGDYHKVSLRHKDTENTRWGAGRVGLGSRYVTIDSAEFR
jgi:hypothetical protein